MHLQSGERIILRQQHRYWGRILCCSRREYEFIEGEQLYLCGVAEKLACTRETHGDSVAAPMALAGIVVRTCISEERRRRRRSIRIGVKTCPARADPLTDHLSRDHCVVRCYPNSGPNSTSMSPSTKDRLSCGWCREARYSNFPRDLRESRGASAHAF